MPLVYFLQDSTNGSWWVTLFTFSILTVLGALTLWETCFKILYSNFKNFIMTRRKNEYGEILIQVRLEIQRKKREREAADAAKKE